MSPAFCFLAATALASTTPGGGSRPTYSLLTLSSGHTFRVLNSGPMLDGKGRRLALAISYLSPARTLQQLEASADELFEYLRPHAEQQDDKDVVVIAKVGSGPEEADYEMLYERQDSGEWKRARGPRRPLPEPAADPEADERDLAAERAAEEDSGAWLALVDAGRFEQSFEVAAPFLQQRTTPQGWAQTGKAMRASLGKALSRKQISVMETHTVPSAPPGRYIVVEFRSKFAKRPVAFESVTEMLCDDGKWRVAGYALR